MPTKLAPYAFAPGFEAASVRQFLADPVLGARIIPHLKPDRFPDPIAGLLAEAAQEVFSKTGTAPTSTAVLQAVRMRVESGAVPAAKMIDAALLLERAEEAPPVDSTYVQQVYLEEARQSAMYEALDNGLHLLSRRDWDGIAEAVNRAAGIGRVDASPGTNVHKSLDKRTDNRRSGRLPLRHGTGILELDDRLLGGLPIGCLGVVAGPPKRGKSLFLSQVAIHIAQHGGSAWYYSMEIDEEMITDRIDAAISRVPMDQLREKADYVREVVDAWFEDCGGSILVKQFPSYSTSCRDIEEHMKMLRAEHGSSPTVLIADSGDFMAPSQRQQRQDLDLGNIYSELRGLGVNWKVPVWTASWVKGEAYDKEVTGMGDVGESKRKVGVSDLGITINSTEEEYQSGVVRLYVAWCRYSQGGFSVGPYKAGYREGRLVADQVVDGDE